MRFGLGWRKELGTGILANLDRIDVVEVLAEELFDAGRAERRAMRFLATQVPVVLHATSLGLASPEPVDDRRLESIARVVGWLEPELWSEHLAFVRSGGREIGHLAAPPRNDATLAGLMRNLERAKRVVGSAPLLENVASLIEPPCSTYAEGEWLNAVLGATDCDLLLDLHNIHANAVNFGFSASAVVSAVPASRIGMIHLAGGRRIERDRLLDDHLHDVPSAVYDLLPLVSSTDATVILERDGNYPSIDALLEQLDLARAACRRADRRPSAPPPSPRPVPGDRGGEPVTRLLARLYTDDALRARFIAEPRSIALSAGCSSEEAERLAAMDCEDLVLASRGFERKRRAKEAAAPPNRAQSAGH